MELASASDIQDDPVDISAKRDGEPAFSSAKGQRQRQRAGAPR